MSDSNYNYTKSLDILTFDFESIGPNGVSKKKIVYSCVEVAPEYYNLSLFEVLEGGKLDVFFESKNNDLHKILSTVYKTMEDFFSKYPKNRIIFTGSTSSRTRLYRIAINKLKIISEEKYLFEGVNNFGNLEEFIPNQEYQAFVISIKYRKP